MAVDEAATGSVVHEGFVEALGILSPEERSVIEHRFSFKDPAGGTPIRKVAKSMGMIPSKVKRIETSALKKLMRPKIAQSLGAPLS